MGRVFVKARFREGLGGLKVGPFTGRVERRSITCLRLASI
jgi:hypothetical protein